MAPLPLDDVRRFLADHHGATVEALEPLSGGFWSAAYGYRVGEDELVLRVGRIRSGFEADRDAMAFADEHLPVPELLEIGDAFGLSYAISRRHHGRFLEDVTAAEADVAGPMLGDLLRALRSAPTAAVGSSWRERLAGGLRDDDPDHPTHGWRRRLADHPEAEATFEDARRRVHDLLPACPERRDLVHGDLLHRNVLVDDDARRVTAVFSWKCSVRGDFLYDTAWCTFWGEAFHPGIAAADPWRRTIDDPTVTPADLADAAVRHHCYELQIAASHLGWYSWTEDEPSLRRLTALTGELLERVPRSHPAQGFVAKH
jgi:aminoglycoside phosphotransferase (APT) family kinase protein